MHPSRHSERVLANSTPEPLARMITREVARMITNRLFSKENFVGTENYGQHTDDEGRLMSTTVRLDNINTLRSHSKSTSAEKPRPVHLDRDMAAATARRQSDQGYRAPMGNLAFRTTWFAPPVWQTGNSEDDVLEFEGAEHQYLGDKMNLMGVNTVGDGEAAAFSIPLIKISGQNFRGDRNDDVWLTYGQICALAGDFYGTFTPISNGKGPEEQRQLFMDAWETLVNNPQDQPADVREILDLLDKEKELIWSAYGGSTEPSEMYGTNDGVSDHGPYQEITMKRTHPKLPTYLALAALNVDHFGDDALLTYITGHKWAIEVAAKEKTLENLKFAYAINAFADHFLQDMFSAGHLRTPRRAMHYEPDGDYDPRDWNEMAGDDMWKADINLTRDVLSKFMHDEESAIGLQVQTRNGSESWYCYGDKRLLDKVNATNLQKCRAAVEASAREVYDAWNNQEEFRSEYEYEIFKRRPYVDSSTPLSVDSSTRLSPLFQVASGAKEEWDNVEIRLPYTDRRSKYHSTTWPMTLPGLKASVGILGHLKILTMFQYPGIQNLQAGGVQ